MKYSLAILLTLSFSIATVLQASSAKAHRRILAQIHHAVDDINSIMATPDKAIPQSLLNDALCVGIIPSELKFAFGVGGSYGRGLLVCRRHGNGAWGAPAFFTLGGGSFGFQLGGRATDVVFLVMNPSGMRNLARSAVKLGADASAAAGPVGRTAAAATSAQMSAEILTYSRSRGLFAGVSLEGSVIKQALADDAVFYGRKVSSQEILLHASLPTPPEARILDQTLEKYSPHGGKPLSQ